MAYNLERLEQALVNADKAGDTEAAKAFAGEIRRMRQPQEMVSSTALPDAFKESNKESPTLLDAAFGEASLGDYGSGIVNRLKNSVNPDTYSNAANELKNFPSAPRMENGKIDLSTPENLPEDESVSDNAMGAVMSVMPASAISKAFRATLKPGLGAADAARQAALDVAGKAGFSVPRSNIKQTTMTNLGERFGGKQAIEAGAQAKNQSIINKFSSRTLGLADDAPITPDVLKGIREEAGKSYEAVKNVGTLTASREYRDGLKKIGAEMSGASKDFPELASAEVSKLVTALDKKAISSEGAVEMVKNLRNSAKSNFGPMASAQDKLLGKAQRKAADLLDDLIEINIEPVLGKEMLNSYRKARELIAKTYTAENALVGQNISGQKIAKIGKKVPLTGEFKQIADFANSFPRLSRVEMGAPPSGGLLEPLIYGTLGGLATGGPGAAAAAIPIIGKPIARRLMVTVPKVSSKPTGPEGNEYIAELIRRAISAPQDRSQ